MSGDRSPSHDCGLGTYPLTVMPIERAVPAMIRSAMSRSFALRSAIFFSAISRTCARVTEPTLVVCGVPEPLATPDALISNCAAGGVFRTNVNDRSSKTLICAGTMSPRCCSVAALYCLQNSMMFTPCWPRAGPTGGAGVAEPAFSCSVKVLTSFFFGGMSLPGLESMASVLPGGGHTGPARCAARRLAPRYRAIEAGRSRVSQAVARDCVRLLDLRDLVEVELNR